MSTPQRAPWRAPTRTELLAERALARVHHFLHIEAVSGGVLLLAATVALVWANSAWAAGYHALWQWPLSLGLGPWVVSQPLLFWINDALMTVFFLAVGMEIRREMHEGALSDLRQAALPIGAALGGVLLPALIYLAFNHEGPRLHGWAVPAATDIAFAVGVLALLGRGIPGTVRIFLLALAIIDDVVAVLIIALFYSGGLQPIGFAIAGLGLAMVLLWQRLGVGSAWAYVLPGAVVWGGLLATGAHPTLAGVVLGLMTPVLAKGLGERPLDRLARLAGELLRPESSAGPGGSSAAAAEDADQQRMRQLRVAQRELLPPVLRVQAALHPWVAFGVMPLFALANAGVSLDGLDLQAGGAVWVSAGVATALVVGKPLGVVGASWLLLRLGWCRLPPGLNWGGLWLIGLLAGIGFTMSMFIAMLGFQDPGLLGAAKLGVLVGSLVAALAGLGWGWIHARRLRAAASA